MVAHDAGDGIDEVAAIDAHGQIGDGAGSGIRLGLARAGDRGEDEDARATPGHREALFWRAIRDGGDDDIMKAGAIEHWLGDGCDRDPAGPLDLPDEGIAKHGVGGDDPDG